MDPRDRVIALMRKAGIPVTRENYIATSWGEPVPVLASAGTKILFERLRQAYEYIIVDLPPLAPVVDVRGMTHLVDSFAFVIEWGRTKIDVVERALRTAPGVYDNLLGVVLNKADFNLLGRYESQCRDYFYNRHHARYGYVD